MRLFIPQAKFREVAPLSPSPPATSTPELSLIKLYNWRASQHLSTFHTRAHSVDRTPRVLYSAGNKRQAKINQKIVGKSVDSDGLPGLGAVDLDGE